MLLKQRHNNVLAIFSKMSICFNTWPRHVFDMY